MHAIDKKRIKYTQLRRWHDDAGNVQQTLTAYNAQHEEVYVLRSLTKDEVTTVRKLAREVAKKHSTKVWVRQSARGSIKHTTAIYGDSKTTGARIELHEALLARGYESHTLDLESHYLRLAREHEHTRLDVLIMKRAQ